MYSVKIFKTVGILHAPAFVSFSDHSNEFNSGSTSGTGKFFDELLDKYKNDEGKVPPVQSWPELENLMVEEELRESVAESLKLVQVH